MHLNHCYGDPPDPNDRIAGLTPEEIHLIVIDKFGIDEQGCRALQSTRPQTLGYGPNDSPVGLAARICEKYRHPV
jgi:hypothetical protein